MNKKLIDFHLKCTVMMYQDCLLKKTFKYEGYQESKVPRIFTQTQKHIFN